MSAHSASARGGWLSALVAQVSDYVFEPIEETVEPEPVALAPRSVVAVVSAAPRSGATAIARLLGAELAARGDGSALVTSSTVVRRTAPPSRPAARLATAMAGVGRVQPLGRICLMEGRPGDDVLAAARYLAPVILDLPPDGSAAGVASVADRIVVVGSAAGEPALLEAVATVVGGDPVRVVNRVTDAGEWSKRADLLLPDSRIAARAAALGTRPLGPLASGIAKLADALGQ